jgi:hypothetical protein
MRHDQGMAVRGLEFLEFLVCDAWLKWLSEIAS